MPHGPNEKVAGRNERQDDREMERSSDHAAPLVRFETRVYSRSESASAMTSDSY